MKVDLRAFKSMLYKMYKLNAYEVPITIGDGKFRGRVVDVAHVAMLDITLRLQDCKMKPETIGLDVLTLNFKIQALPAGDVSKKEHPENNIKIEPVVEKGTITSLKFKHPMLKFNKNLVDTTSLVEAKFPKSLLEDVRVTANINTRQLKIFLKIAEKENDHIYFIAEKKGNKLKAEYTNDAEELIETDLTYSLGGIEGTDLQFLAKSPEKVKAIFTVDYMKDFLTNLKAPTIKIGLKNDSPLIIWWKEGNNLSGVYLLAPRIESE